MTKLQIRFSPLSHGDDYTSNHELYLLITMLENFSICYNLQYLFVELRGSEEYYDIVCLFPLIFILI